MTAAPSRSATPAVPVTLVSSGRPASRQKMPCSRLGSPPGVALSTTCSMRLPIHSLAAGTRGSSRCGAAETPTTWICGVAARLWIRGGCATRYSPAGSGRGPGRPGCCTWCARSTAPSCAYALPELVPWTDCWGFDLHGRTVGVIRHRFGSVCCVTHTMAVGFGCRVLAHDVSVDPGLIACGVDYVGPLPVDTRQSDVLTLHCPLTPETRHLVCASHECQP